jgi:hypothetical protein
MAAAAGAAALPVAEPVRSHAGGPGMPTIVAPALFDPAAVWSAVAADTTPTLAGDTGRTSPADLKRRPHKPTMPPRPKRTRYYIAGGVGAAVLVGLITWAAWPSKPKTKPTTDAPAVAAAEPTKLYVTKVATNPDATHTFTSLAAALAQARPKDTVVLLDPTWEEGPIRVNGRGKTGIRDVTIESESPTRETIWQVMGAKKADAAFELVDTPNITIRGVTIQAGAYAVGLSVVGNCPGLTFDRVTVAHATKIGIRLANAVGDPTDPIALSRVRVVAAAGSESGVEFRATQPAVTKHVKLSWCRIEGPGRYAVYVYGPISDVEMSTSRLFNWDAGVALRASSFSDAPLQLTLSSNTVYEMKYGGVRIDGDFPTGVKAELAFTRNYFAKSPEVVSFINSKVFDLPGLKPTDNARETVVKESKNFLKSFEVANAELDSTDPQSSQFLRYQRSNKLATAGPNRVPVGVPPD